MKDVPGILPDGLVIAAALPREDARDAAGRAFARRPAARRAGRHDQSGAGRRRCSTSGPTSRSCSFAATSDPDRQAGARRGGGDATRHGRSQPLGLKPDLARSTSRTSSRRPGGRRRPRMPGRRRRVLALAARVEHGPSAVALAAERAYPRRTLDGRARSAIAIRTGSEPDGGFVLRAAVFAPDGSIRHDAALRLAAARRRLRRPPRPRDRHGAARPGRAADRMTGRLVLVTRPAAKPKRRARPSRRRGFQTIAAPCLVTGRRPAKRSTLMASPRCAHLRQRRRRALAARTRAARHPGVRGRRSDGGRRLHRRFRLP